uniref:Lipopolysaccharide core biosynthesis mannosyltransferase lpsB n=1 Tax=Cajanus cajan TaxID=3821 RepID=A0A151TC68_CAJCA|nr:Lipopolysaccharide core biosynthesis mannosyltransferase lpsB [Cajanus cajan]
MAKHSVAMAKKRWPIVLAAFLSISTVTVLLMRPTSSDSCNIKNFGGAQQDNQISSSVQIGNAASSPLHFMKSKLVLMVSHELSLSGGPLLLMELAFLLRGVGSDVVWITNQKPGEPDPVIYSLESKMLDRGVQKTTIRSSSTAMDEDMSALVLETLSLPGSQYQTGTRNQPTHILRSDLKFVIRLWQAVIYNNILPLTHTSDITIARAKLIFCIMQQRDVDIATLISDDMHAIVLSKPSKSGTVRPLAFLGLITEEVCRAWRCVARGGVSRRGGVARGGGVAQRRWLRRGGEERRSGAEVRRGEEKRVVEEALRRIKMPETYVVHLGNSKELMEVAEDSVAKRVLREHVRESLGVRNDDLLFAIINSVSRGKGQDLFLRSFYESLQLIQEKKLQLPSLHAVVVGSDMDKQTKFEMELRKFVVEKKIQDRVHFVNKTLAVAPYLASIDVLVQNSQARGECFGRITIEAMAFRLPVLGTAAGGTMEIVVNGTTGLLHPVAKEGVIPLAKNIVKLATHVEKRLTMGKKGYERVKERFLEHHMSQRIALVLKDVLQKARQ